LNHAKDVPPQIFQVKNALLTLKNKNSDLPVIEHTRKTNENNKGGKGQQKPQDTVPEKKPTINGLSKKERGT